jgi:S1-C subfamily serine protease
LDDPEIAPQREILMRSPAAFIGVIGALLIAALIAAPAVAGEARSGSGIVVSATGDILTNDHVIAECSTIRLNGAGYSSAAATLVARDPGNDLALLRAEAKPAAFAVFRDGRGIRSGDEVVAVGFPLPGLLASEANVTVGGVSALAGLRDDARYLQITAPVQPGSSGGALLDFAGNLVGIVSAKLNGLKVAAASGDIPQNINFAVKSDIARSFLASRGVDYATAPSTMTLSPADIGERAKLFTLRIDCDGAPATSAAAHPIAAPKSANHASAVGLELRRINYSRGIENGVPQLVIVGEVANLSQVARAVPKLRIVLRDRDGKNLQAVNFMVARPSLQPGASAAFRKIIPAPSAAASKAVVTFADPG